MQSTIRHLSVLQALVCKIGIKIRSTGLGNLGGKGGARAGCTGSEKHSALECGAPVRLLQAGGGDAGQVSWPQALQLEPEINPGLFSQSPP